MLPTLVPCAILSQSPDASRLLEAFYNNYLRYYPNKDAAKEAGAKIVLTHVYTVLSNVPENTELFSLSFAHDLLGTWTLELMTSFFPIHAIVWELYVAEDALDDRTILS